MERGRISTVEGGKVILPRALGILPIKWAHILRNIQQMNFFHMLLGHPWVAD